MVKRRRNKNWIGWLVFLVLIIAATIVIILFNNNIFGEKKNNEERTGSNVTKEDNTSSNNTETEPDKTQESQKNEVTKEDIPQYAGDNPNKAEELTGVISYADVNGNDLIIRVNINQFLSSGSCSLVITKNGASIYTEKVNIEESVTTSTCAGFKIPVSSLSSGDLQIEIELDAEGKEGTIIGKVRI